MKKILTLFSFFVFSLPFSVQAAVLFSQDITLKPGWNIISTPRLLESHSFSLPETTDNFDIFVLNTSSTASWSTLADIGQTEFMPLYGYFVNNKSSSTQTLTFNYKADIAPNDRLFERTFSKAGWYSIGVANPTYAKGNTDAVTDTNNPSKVLSSLSGGYDSVLDLTDDSFVATPSSVAVGSAWKQGVSGDVDSLNDLRETKGYVVYIKQAGAFYSGFQNNTQPATSTTPTPTVTTPTFIVKADFTATTSPKNSLHVKIASFTFKAGAEAVTINSLGFNPVLSNPLSSNFSNVFLEIDGVASPALLFSAGTTTVTSLAIPVDANGTKTFDLYTDFGGDIGEVITTAMEATYTSGSPASTNKISSAGVSVTSIDTPLPALP